MFPPRLSGEKLYARSKIHSILRPRMRPSPEISLRAIATILVSCLAMIQGGDAIAQSFNEEDVKQWILAGLANKKEFRDPMPDQSLAKNYSTNQVLEGWVRLKRCRDAGMSLDLSLAAAEHYGFMRFVANKNGDTYYRSLPKWYERVKTALTWADLEQIIRSNPTSPVSPVDSRVTQWGERGVEAGLKDYKAREHKDPEPKTAAFVTSVGVAYVLYSPYKGSANATCAVSIKH